MYSEHNIQPVFDSRSKILILGSFPSVKSRECRFFYGHPQNRFWRVISGVFNDCLPQTVDEKKVLLLAHGIALWDVIASCDVEGSSDSSIRNVIPNDIGYILSACSIERIFTNGKTAAKLYDKFIFPVTGRKAICLPSTSPANASYSLERLTVEWRKAIES